MTTPKRAMHCSNDISITSLRADSICMVSICTEGHSPSVAKLRGLTAYRCGSTEFIVAHTLFIVQYCFTRLSHLDIKNSNLPNTSIIYTLLIGMAYTLNRYIDVPRFLTNLSHEKMNIVKLFMRLNEFSSVRHINIARACL